MKNKIAVPDTPYLKEMFINSDKIKKEYGVEFFVVPEDKIGEFFANNRFDLALLSPKDYAMGIGKADYRIVEGPCMASEAYTKLASVYFNPNLADIATIGSPTPDNFLIQIARLLLAERYDMHPNISKHDTNVAESLAKYDAVIALNSDSKIEAALDISEEWYINSSSPLPLAFWVCRNVEAPENTKEIVKKIAADFYQTEVIIHEHSEDESLVREGRILKTWNEEIAQSLVEVIELLYYHQYIPEIGDVKMYGDED